MTTIQAKIRDAAIRMTFVPGDVSPLQVPQEFDLPIWFKTVSNLQSMNGSFTPANNSQAIHTFSATDQANFILLVVDQPAVLNLASNGNSSMVSNLCVQRFFYIGLQNLTSLLASLSLNGAVTGPEVPMQQSVVCNWTLYYGVANIS